MDEGRKPEIVEEDRGSTSVERDPRYPSGRWTGYWTQQDYSGRHQMELELVFGGGAIVGEGSDFAGHFTVTGRYVADERRCDMIKQYTDGPAIRWDGGHFGNVIWIAGAWQLPQEFQLRGRTHGTGTRQAS
jgi:hypothetical protein